MTRKIPSRRRVWIAAGVGGAAVAGLGLLLLASSWRAGRTARVVATGEAEATPAGPVEPAPRPVELVTFEMGCSTPACHAGFGALPVVHGPVAASSCEVCHLPDSGGHVYPQRAGGNAVCLSCHDLGPMGAFQHLAVSEDGCLSCHEAHASASPSLLRGSSQHETCGGCHPSASYPVGHEPFTLGLCTSCHEPHSGANALLLRGEQPSDHCAGCHEPVAAAMREAAHGHGDLDGSCLRCHVGHGAEHEGLLTADSASQCLRCHDAIRESIRTALVTHRGAMTDRACLTCHAPHGTPDRSMLRDSQEAVCMACHNAPVVAVDGRTIPDMTAFVRDALYIHGAVRSGDCSACHSVHGAEFDHLLRDRNPELVVGEFDLRNYALCFSCHSSELVTEPESPTATQFRQGDRNLHQLHVANGGRSRSCSNCHIVHGGNRPRLMADFPAYEGSGWRMPLGFVLSENGGSCAPGCHQPQSYERTPARGPARPAGGSD